MVEDRQFLKDIGELITDISLFVNKLNPNPTVAIAAIEIFKDYVVNKYIFKIEVHDVKITYSGIRELYDQLWTFFKELDLYDHPDLIITALDLTKYYYVRDVERQLKEYEERGKL